MDPFDQIWESSRSNGWSWGYPTVIGVAILTLLVLSLVRNATLRGVLKALSIVAFSFLATDFAAREIQEKWRIRREWAQNHSEQMTEAGAEALTIDGANLTLGPLLLGVRAMLVMFAACLVLFLIRKLATRIMDARTNEHAPLA